MCKSNKYELKCWKKEKISIEDGSKCFAMPLRAKVPKDFFLFHSFKSVWRSIRQSFFLYALTSHLFSSSFSIFSFPPKLSSISCPVRHFIFLCYQTVNYFSISTAMSAFLFHFYVFIFSFCLYQIALKQWNLIAFLGKTFLSCCGLFQIVNFYGF